MKPVRSARVKLLSSLALSALLVMTAFSAGGGCGGGGSSSRGGVPTYSSAGPFGSYRSNTDKWHIKFEEVQLKTTLAGEGFTQDDAGPCMEACINYLNQYYSGYAISFSTAPYDSNNTPAPGTSENIDTIGSDAYNTISIRISGGNPGATGRALTDLYNNSFIEHDAATSAYHTGQELGVFLDVFGNVFPPNTLTLDQFSKFLAAVIAHEIGHSLGIENHNDSTPNIMNSVADFSDLNQVLSFAAPEQAILSANLPGPNRE